MAEIKAKLTLTTEEEIRILQDKVKELKKEVELMEKYKAYRDAADETFMMKKSFVDAGFSDEEAMKLILGFVKTFKN